MEELRPSKDTPYRHVIETIPGIGPVLAAAIIGEIGDILVSLTPGLLLPMPGLMLQSGLQDCLRVLVTVCLNAVPCFKKQLVVSRCSKPAVLTQR